MDVATKRGIGIERQHRAQIGQSAGEYVFKYRMEKNEAREGMDRIGRKPGQIVTVETKILRQQQLAVSDAQVRCHILKNM